MTLPLEHPRFRRLTHLDTGASHRQPDDPGIEAAAIRARLEAIDQESRRLTIFAIAGVLAGSAAAALFFVARMEGWL